MRRIIAGPCRGLPIAGFVAESMAAGFPPDQTALDLLLFVPMLVVVSIGLEPPFFRARLVDLHLVLAEADALLATTSTDSLSRGGTSPYSLL